MIYDRKIDERQIRQMVDRYYIKTNRNTVDS